MSEHAALIAKLEAADGPSRELDQEIGVSIGDRRPDHNWVLLRLGSYVADAGGWNETFWIADNYTSSIDAALTLVPAWCGWNVDGHRESIVTKNNVNSLGEREDDDWYSAYHKTPAIALCIAALKARQ